VSARCASDSEKDGDDALHVDRRWLCYCKECVTGILMAIRSTQPPLYIYYMYDGLVELSRTQLLYIAVIGAPEPSVWYFIFFRLAHAMVE
jgi:hypothetical protein